jgi:hypothetical protein
VKRFLGQPRALEMGRRCLLGCDTPSAFTQGLVPGGQMLTGFGRAYQFRYAAHPPHT